MYGTITEFGEIKDENAGRCFFRSHVSCGMQYRAGYRQGRAESRFRGRKRRKITRAGRFLCYFRFCGVHAMEPVLLPVGERRTD